MKKICKIVLCLVILLLVLSLFGCSKTEPISHTIADNAIAATTALEQQLPVECKTEAVTTQVAIIKTEIRAVKNACDTEKNQITQDKMKWKIGFWMLAVAVIAYAVKKIMK